MLKTRRQRVLIATDAPSHLSEELIREVYQAATDLGLAVSRSALLAGMPPGVTAGLAVHRTPSIQLLADLKGLNRMGPRDTAPLRQWLEAAMAVSPRSSDHLHPTAMAFKRALDALDGQAG